MMKIYFCGSIRAGRGDVGLYGRLIKKLGQYGSVLTPFVGDPSIGTKGSEMPGGDRAIHDRDVEWLQESDGEERRELECVQRNAREPQTDAKPQRTKLCPSTWRRLTDESWTALWCVMYCSWSQFMFQGAAKDSASGISCLPTGWIKIPYSDSSHRKA